MWSHFRNFLFVIVFAIFICVTCVRRGEEGSFLPDVTNMWNTVGILHIAGSLITSLLTISNKECIQIQSICVKAKKQFQDSSSIPWVGFVAWRPWRTAEGGLKSLLIAIPWSCFIILSFRFRQGAKIWISARNWTPRMLHTQTHLRIRCLCDRNRMEGVPDQVSAKNQEKTDITI